MSRGDRIDRVNLGETDLGYDQATDRGTDDRSDLKDAVVPGNRVSKGITRNERRKK